MKKSIVLLLMVFLIFGTTAIASEQHTDTDTSLISTQSMFTAGNYVTFGSYPQTATGDDSTPIEWQVLKLDGNKALLISRYALACKPFNDVYDVITWETSTLRSWLNDAFLNKAFSAEEQNGIIESDVSADANPRFGTNPGNVTQDKVFILSVDEANELFASDEAMICQASDWAVAQGAWTDDSGACWWWLRTPGNYQEYAVRVIYDGGIHLIGNRACYPDHCVRPVLWIDLDSGIF